MRGSASLSIGPRGLKLVDATENLDPDLEWFWAPSTATEIGGSQKVLNTSQDLALHGCCSPGRKWCPFGGRDGRRRKGEMVG